MKLTEAQINALAQIEKTTVLGPAPGWNADIEISTPEGPVCGSELKPLFEMGLLSAQPASPPHVEDFNEDSGSITLDSTWIITPAGRAALEASR